MLVYSNKNYSRLYIQPNIILILIFFYLTVISALLVLAYMERKIPKQHRDSAESTVSGIDGTVTALPAQ